MNCNKAKSSSARGMLRGRKNQHFTLLRHGLAWRHQHTHRRLGQACALAPARRYQAAALSCFCVYSAAAGGDGFGRISLGWTSNALVTISWLSRRQTNCIWRGVGRNAPANRMAAVGAVGGWRQVAASALAACAQRAGASALPSAFLYLPCALRAAASPSSYMV